MKIKKISWNKHKILGNLELDLYNNSKNKPYNIIVLAGENGSGKTTIFETLSNFLNKGNNTDFSNIEYIVNGKIYSALPPKNGIGYIQKNSESNAIEKLSNLNNNCKTIDNDEADIRHFGCSYSRAQISFRTNKIDTIKTNTIDKTKYQVKEIQDFTIIKQLLVDINIQDSNEFINEAQKNDNIQYSVFEKRSRIYRFKRAFNNFFEHIKFDRIQLVNDDYKIIFKKFDTEIDIDSLSTGEKQIIFRGAYLLQNSKALANSVIFIDEPELSMHPKWQEKIFDFYINLFKFDDIEFVPQIFIATHSENILKKAISNKDTVVFVLKNDNGIIRSDKISAPKNLKSLTSSEINYLAFNIISNDYHIELFSYLQSKISIDSIKRMDDYIFNSQEFKSNENLYSKCSQYRNVEYKTLPVYIRNSIDHPESGNKFNENELKISIELLIELCGKK